MAYCPKCGVEVDNNIRSCPLCDFPIPDITGVGEASDLTYEKYPEASNIYEEHRHALQIRVFLLMLVLTVSVLAILFAVSIIYPASEPIIRYLLPIFSAVFFYSFFFIGFLNKYSTMTGLALTTLALTFTLSNLMVGSWFLSYALPLIILVYVNSLFFMYIFSHSKRKKRLGYLHSFILLILAILSLGVDGIISYNIRNRIDLTWSIIVAFVCMTVAYLVHFIVNHLPTEFKETVQRKLHL